MTSIDRISAQDAARLYAHRTDITRTAATPSAAVQPVGKANQRTVQTADSVSLSDNARSMSTARTAVQNAPDVREKKVAHIKQQLTYGTYQLSAQALARKMLTSSDIQN